MNLSFLRRPWPLMLFSVTGGTVLALLLFIFGSDMAVREAGAGRSYNEVTQIPHRTAALVLGCARTLPNGRGNLYFRNRMEAAAALFHAGGTDFLIVSGDNSRDGYDEPTAMREALLAAGVPGERIYQDYAGFRTLDSVVRAREIFGQEEITIVSQGFHNERALYLAQGHGIDAIGLNAADVSGWGGFRTRAREYLARCRSVLDLHVLGTKPKFLGPTVIPGRPAGGEGGGRSREMAGAARATASKSGGDLK